MRVERLTVEEYEKKVTFVLVSPQKMKELGPNSEN